MKKHLLSLLLSLVAPSCLLAQSALPSDSGNGAPAASVTPVQHLEATYNITSKQSKPMGTVTWIADLTNDTAPYGYQVTVTLQNNSDKVFGTWNLAMIFLGSVTAVSPEASARGYMFSDGPAPGYIIFGGVSEQGTMDLAPHGSIAFTYAYELPASQQTLEAPAKLMLSRGISYVMTPTPVATAPSDSTPANP